MVCSTLAEFARLKPVDLTLRSTLNVKKPFQSVWLFHFKIKQDKPENLGRALPKHFPAPDVTQ